MAKKTADLTVPAAMFQMGAFPMVCAKTGAPAEERKSITATHTSPWAAVGILGGVLGVVVLSMILRKQIAGSVPLAAKSGPTTMQTYGYWTLGAAGVAFASMFVLPSSVVGWGFLGFAIFGIVGGGMVIVSGERIQAALASDQQTVTLKKVHPNFAEVVRHMMISSSMYAHGNPSNMPMPPVPYQVAPPMPSYGNSGIPPMPAAHPPAPNTPLPAVAAAPKPAPAFVDPFRN